MPLGLVGSKLLQGLTFLLLALVLSCDGVSAATKYFHFTIQNTTVTRNCYTKSLVSVNGQFPGPTQYVTEGDEVVVNVTNLVSYNVTIHWHGVRQLLSNWADGPAYITQCPIKTNNSYVYRFKIIDQRGTLLWHAHFSWLRATVYGAFIIQKKTNAAYPFHQKPGKSVGELPPVLLGEWWNANVIDVITQALAQGGGYNTSDAITINGQPGDLYNCSSAGTVVYNVIQGETVLLRVINAALNFHMYFAVANHSLTVVEADAEYTEPFTTDVIILAPGQTTNVLLTANKTVGKYYMAASIFSPPNPVFVPFPTTAATAILSYKGSNTNSHIAFPSLPLANDSAVLNNFTDSLRGRNQSEGYYYMDVPQKVDVDLLHTVGLNAQPCNPAERTCGGIFGDFLAASMNNISFVSPNISLLQAYVKHINGVYTTDFPDAPLVPYNYTGVNPIVDMAALPGTKVKVLPFNSAVQVVYQNTATLVSENHPIHLHGQNFYVVGTGSGNYNSTTDPANFNLKNPASRNTITVPAGGWAAVRFRAANPGVWFVHCHFDIHQSWGLDMAFITLNGKGPFQTLPPLPADFPKC